MAKMISVAGLGHGGASRAIQEAQQEPVLVSKENRPVAWIISAERLAEVAAARGEAAGDAYQRALKLIAVELYREAILTLGQGAMLASMSLSDFIDLCGRLYVPILWEPERGLEAELEAAEAMADISRTSA